MKRRASQGTSSDVKAAKKAHVEAEAASSSSKSSPVSVWLDCDPGHDDACAIMLAGHHEAVKLIGISVRRSCHFFLRSSCAPHPLPAHLLSATPSRKRLWTISRLLEIIFILCLIRVNCCGCCLDGDGQSDDRENDLERVQGVRRHWPRGRPYASPPLPPSVSS